MTTYQLNVILDVFSRYVPGWMVAHRESAILARRLIEAPCAKQRIARAASRPWSRALLNPPVRP